MAVKFPDKMRCKDLGDSELVTCPSCNNQVEMKLFNSVDKSILIKLLDKKETINYAVCPVCCNVFTVKDEYIQARSEENTVQTTTDDYTPVERS